jgi:hypothetical protein
MLRRKKKWKISVLSVSAVKITDPFGVRFKPLVLQVVVDSEFVVLKVLKALSKPGLLKRYCQKENYWYTYISSSNNEYLNKNP